MSELRDLLSRLQTLVNDPVVMAEAALPLSDNLIPGAKEKPPMRRIHGPYQHRANAWRIVEVDTVTKARTVHTFKTEKEALSSGERLRKEAARQNGATVDQLLSLYKEHLTAKGNKPRSIETTLYRVGRVLAPFSSRALTALTKTDVAVAVSRLTDMSGDSRLNMAAETRTFLRWCRSQGHASADLAPDVKVQARRTKGKAQLRIDEARRWIATAMELVPSDSHVLAACMALLMGMRASEIAERTARDLDDGGRLLWIPRAKTRAGVRRLAVPEILRPHLLKLVSVRKSDERIFPGATRWTIRHHTLRICRLAQVPQVGPHSMRGLHGTLAVASGITSEQVAAALGHESFATTEAHYADPDALTAHRSHVARELLTSSPAVPQLDIPPCHTP